MTVRLGLVTPIVSMNPRVAAGWEATATPQDLVAVARAADRFGFRHLTCSEHVAVPPGAVTATGVRRGTRYYDPAVTLGWLAAATERIRLTTHVLVAAYHHPLAVAKTYGTLDVLSGGRVVLGVGVGSLREEFDVLGAPFDDRGARADEFLVALRSAWGEREPTHRGEHYSFDGVVVDPCATTTAPTLWIGGRSGRSLRRALTLGDGWMPFGLADDQIAGLLGRAAGTAEFRHRRRPFDVVLLAEGLDPLDQPSATAERLDALVALGATVVDVRCRHGSLGHLLEQLEALVGVASSVGPA